MAWARVGDDGDVVDSNPVKSIVSQRTQHLDRHCIAFVERGRERAVRERRAFSPCTGRGGSRIAIRCHRGTPILESVAGEPQPTCIVLATIGVAAGGEVE